MAENKMSDTERWTRFGVGIGHTVGGAVLTGFGGGAFVPMIGNAEEMALDAGFKSSRISPGTEVRQAVRESKCKPGEKCQEETPPVTETRVPYASLKAEIDASKSR